MFFYKLHFYILKRNVITKIKTARIRLTNFTLFAYITGITFENSIPNYLNDSTGINNLSGIADARVVFN